MANVKFVPRKGAMKELLSTPQALSVIKQHTDKVETRANSLANKPHGHYNKPYGAHSFLDKKGMARGFVGTRTKYGTNDNLKHNTLLKSLGG